MDVFLLYGKEKKAEVNSLIRGPSFWAWLSSHGCWGIVSTLITDSPGVFSKNIYSYYICLFQVLIMA